jgi:hypothetical protein
MSDPPAAPIVNNLACQVAGNLTTFSGAHPFTTAHVNKTAMFLSASAPAHVG